MNDCCVPLKRPHGFAILRHVFVFACIALLPVLSKAQYSLNFECGTSSAVDAAMIGCEDSLDATIIIPGDTSTIDSILVEIVVKGIPVFWGSTTVTTSAGEVVVIPFPGLITNTGSSEEGAIYRTWVGPCQSIHATTPVIDPLHYNDWQSMTTFQVRKFDFECQSGTSSDGDVLLFHACDTFYFDLDTVVAPLKDVSIIIPLSELGDQDTTRSAIVEINYIHNGVVTNLSIDTFYGPDNLGRNALLIEKLFSIPGNVDSIEIALISPDGVFTNTSCTQQVPFGGDSFIVSTIVVSSACDECCTVETNCDDIPDGYACRFDLVPPIPDVLLDSLATYSGSTNLDSLAFADFGGTYTTNFCDTIYIIASDETTGAGCPGDTGYIVRSFVFFSQSTGVAIDTCGLTYVVLDSINPVITCPADTTLQCSPADFPPYLTLTLFIAAGGSASDDCELDDASFTLLSEVSDGLSCPETVTRTYLIADACGNIATCSQILTLIDTIPPIITCPLDATFECIEDVPPPAVYVLTSISGSWEEVRAEALSLGGDLVAINSAEENALLYSAFGGEGYLWIGYSDLASEGTWAWSNGDPNGYENWAFGEPNNCCIPDGEDYGLFNWDGFGGWNDCDVSLCGPLRGIVELATATDDCGAALITFVGETTTGTCPAIIVRTYQATDNCGNVALCTQTITVDDNTPPSITCPDDLTLECTDSTDPIATGFAIVTDNCAAELFITYADVITPGECPQQYTITRTWSAQDACENIAACVQTIFVDDTIPPSITAPVGDIVQCIEDVVFGDPIVTDNCSEFTTTFADMAGFSVTGTLTGGNEVPPNMSAASGTVIGSYDPNTLMLFVYVEFTGLSAPLTATHIHMAPAGVNGPVIINLGPSAPLGSVSGAYSHTAILTGAQETALLSGGLYLNLHNSIFPGGEIRDQLSVSDCDILVKRTWTATDACGNSSTAFTTVLVSDTTPPEITCPGDATVECPLTNLPPYQTLSQFIAAGGNASDNCALDEASFTLLNELSDGLICPETVTRTYSIADSCGNVATCVQVITVIDTTAPVVTCPEDITLGCFTSTFPDNTGFAIVSDNCDLEPAITYSDVLTPGLCQVELTIVRTWIAVDDCGNVSTCIQIIEVDDSDAPFLTVPDDITIQCGDEPTGVAGATDFCTDVFVTYVDLQCSVTVEGFTGDYDFANWTATGDVVTDGDSVVTLTGPDDGSCPGGQSALFSIVVPADGKLIFSWNYSTNDIDGPAFDPFGYNINGTFVRLTNNSGPSDQSGLAAALVSAGDVFAFEQNSTDCALGEAATTVIDFFVYTCAEEDPADPCNYTVFRCWSATDECGNTAYALQRIHVEDTEAPSITCPDDLTLECDESTDPVSTGTATATDNCDTEVDVTYADVVTPGTCPQEYTITRTWSAADSCGNVATCIQIINVDDTTPPELLCPPGGDFECDGGSPFFTTLEDFLAGGGTASDNCALDSASFTLASGTGIGPCPTVFTFLYTITDLCGNLNSCVHVVTVTDDIPPSITCPDGVFVECIDEVPPSLTTIEEFIAAGGNVFDNCALDSASFASSDLSDGLTCPETITRTYSIADFCGNVSTCVQIITVNDTTPPVVSCSADITIECDQPIPPGIFTATDNCDDTLLLEAISGINLGECPGEFFISRVWFATDDCGNSSSCAQLVTIVDTTPPEISCPADVTIDCDDEVQIEFATAIDNCDMQPYITFTDVEEPGNCPQEFTIFRTWYAEDDCGNVSSCVQVIFVDDSTAPLLTVPDDISIQCGDEPTGDAVATDDCSEVVFITYVDLQCSVTVEGFNGDYDFANWTEDISDGGEIIYNGNTDVTLISPNNGCNGGASALLSITVPEDGKIVFAWNYSTDDDGPFYDPFGYNLNGVFVPLTNDNGPNDQSGLAAALVSAGDVFAFEQHSTDCILGSGATTVVDFFVYTCVEEDPADPCNYTTFRCWSATDECGNTAYALQRIHVEDTEPPGITCPDDLSFDCLVDVEPFGSFDEFIAGGGTVSDNCSIDTASFTLVDAVAIGPCPYVYTFTYGISDSCGNSSQCSMTIVTTDAEPPVLVCPPDESDMCSVGGIPPAGDLDEFIAQGGSVSDNCVVDTASFTLLSEVSDGLTCPQTITRVYQITDLCGNTATCDQTLVIDDTTPPTIVCPANVTVSCAPNVPPVNTGSVTTSDNCGGLVVVTHVGDVITNMTCANRFTVTRTYLATDGCGNTATCAQIITVNDITPPTIACPANVTVSCAANVPPVNIGGVTTSDNCGGMVTVTHISDVITNQTCPNRFTLNRTYRATDLCQNTAQCVQVITVNDVTPPTIVCPADITVTDPDDIDPVDTGTPTTSDNCAGAVTTDYDDVIIPGECAEQFVAERTWTATDVCGNTATCLQIITVDVECTCELTCPPDITINLDPGACDVIYNFNDPTFEGNCPLEIETPTALTQNTNTTLIQDALQCGVNPTSHWRAYDLAAIGAVGDFQMNSLGMASWSAGTVQIFVHTYTGPLPSGTLDLNQMTLVGQSAPTAVGGFSLSTISLTAPVLIPEGSKFVVEQRQLAGGPWCIASNYQGNTQPAYMNCIGSIFGFPAIPTSYAILGYGFIHPIQVLNGALIQQGGELVQISGLPSGSVFPIGTTTNCFQLINTQTGEIVDSCCFDVVVNEYPFEIQPNCNDLIQISLDENCEATICADMILEGGPYGCYDDYIVNVDQYGDLNINCESLTFSFGLHTVTITNPETGNSCWGQILIEDKLPPMITCQDYTLSCGQDLTPVFTPPIQGVYTCSAFPGLPIGPNAGVITTSTCTVSLPQGVEIVDVNVCVKITHTWIGDCNTDIISPSGAVTNLWGFGQCGPTDNMFQKFDDSGPLTVLCADINSGCDFILQPVSFQLGGAPLAQYNTTNPNGEWTLMITDNAGGDGGTLDEWHLEIEYAQNAPFAPTVSDNCDQDVTLTWEDEEFNELCDTTIIERTWTATDDAGNTASCVQTLTIEPLSLDALQCPETYIGTCGQSAHPNETGWPTIDGIPITEGGVCNIFVGYWDQELADCGNGVKIVRRWSILDWCAQEVEECIQIIKLTDDQGPVLYCPDDQTAGSDPWFCNADVNLLIPEAYDACETPFTLTPSVSAGVLVHFGGNFWRVDNLPVGTHTVTWTAEDACGNTSTCSYDLTVIDDVPPVPLCDEHTILTLTYDDPLDEGLTKLHATTLDDGSYDNCGPVTFLARRMDSCIDFDWIGPNGEYPNNDGGLPESLDRGLTFQEWVPFACCDVGTTVMVELRVTDLSGNINSCMVEVEVQDKLPPLIVCPPDVTVSCEFWFDVHETNGFEATDGLEDIFGRVLDAYDYDPSEREYVIIDDPGNDELPQPYHWGLDGWADDNCDVTIDVRTRIFDDCSGDDLPGGAPDWAVRLVERTFRAQDAQGNTSTCRQRIWVVDFDPFYITDTQCGLNNADDVRWPCDLILTDCPEGDLTPANLSAYAPNNAPIVNDDNCSIIGMTYDDQIFYFVDNACYKIVRTWTVIDWCQFDPVENTGYWTYVQVIKVHDEDGPEFLNCPDGPVTYCAADPNTALPSNNQVFLGEADPNSSSCSIHVWEERTVYETCSDIVIYDVKIYPYNGSEYVQIVDKTEVEVDTNGEAILTWDTRQNSLPSNHAIRKYGLPYNDRYCSNWPLSGGVKDYHRVLWSVEDGCGNLNTCEYLLRLEDCKQPTPICVGLSSVVMPTSGSVTIWAKDFDSGSSVDDCTAHEDLLFSFSGDVYEPSRVFDCAAIEANGSPSFLVEIWVADEGNDQNCNGFVQPLGIEWSERNKDFCTTFIVIDDNENVCGNNLTGGLIETEINESVEKVKVSLMDQNNGQVMNTFITSGDGLYHFINPLFDYIIEPARNDNHKNGVSTLDLVAIQKHLLGLQPLNSPYKMIAADANNTESVSALDLVEIRKLILGLYTEFPKNTSWRFVDAGFEFADPTHPWPFDEVIESHSGMTMHEDFVAVKVGDINGTVIANASQITTRGARSVLRLHTSDRDVQMGDVFEVPVTAENYKQMLGYQFTMTLKGLTYAGIEAGTIAMQPEYVGVHPNAITMSWGDVTPVSSDASDILFTLRFVANSAGSLRDMIEITSLITEAEAYTTVGETTELLDVMLTFGETTVGQVLEFALYQNEPNPFADQTIIGFDLPSAMSATLTLYDVSGKVVRVVEGEYAKGYNEVVLKRKDLSSDGAYYYHLQAGDFSASKKMILTR